ncbi:MAG: caspase family protein [Holophagales bacterium]|nr:caspase family protein [Holophagales bacterium]
MPTRSARAGRPARALLVGIRTYPAVPSNQGQSLAGCHNDVAAMRRALLGRGFHERDLEILTDLVEGCGCRFCEAAPDPGAVSPTREAILAAMDRLLEATRPDDIAVFYFSGHGSEFAGRGLHTGRRFQTFVPHDSGRGDAENRDISDREIEAWVRRMGERTPHLTLIFDCCHSGGAADLRSEPQEGRRIAADRREAEDACTPALRREWRQEAPASGQRASGALVLSACAAHELASETDVDGRRHGLFTHHLSRVLERPAAPGETWADLFPEIADAVTAENLAQHPRRGGNGPVFAAGPFDPEDIDPPDIVELAKLAVVIGIDYQRPEGAGEGFTPLTTPHHDAREVARVLAEEQGYEIVGLSERHEGPLLGEKATRRRIHRLIERLASVKARAHRETAVVIYFAGHGVTRIEEAGGESRGYLVPWDGDARDSSTWVAMQDLRDQLVDGIGDPDRLEVLEQRGPLSRLHSRHLLVVLDCCFGGALAYDFYRSAEVPERPIYYSEYKRFVEGTAWQLLSSASYNQQALDRDPKDPDEPFSPFARALIEGLTLGAADSRSEHGRSDHLITATELHEHISRQLRAMAVDIQTPGLVDLRPRDGQFIFSVPGYSPSPLPDPPLGPGSNPWRGPLAYGSGDDAVRLFFGREQATLDLLESFLECRAAARSSPEEGESTAAPLAVVGPSGCGKTSLLRAGLLPILRDPAAARRRLVSWSRRNGLGFYLASREDLRQLREWARELSLGELLEEVEDSGAAEEQIVQRIRTWAAEGGLRDLERASPGGSGAPFHGGAGVPALNAGSPAEEQAGCLRRLGVFPLLEQPALLRQRLRLWTRERGLADFFSLPERALSGLVGRFEVTENAEEIPADAGEATLWLCEPLEGPARELDVGWWGGLLCRRDVQVVAAVGSRSLVHDPAVRSLLGGRVGPAAAVGWRIHRITRPSREELREAILGPAAAQVLFFEPEELPDSLAEEGAAMPAPLPLLSRALASMVENAWQRRGQEDRFLTTADLPAGEGAARPIASFSARRAEGLHRRLSAENPAERRLLRSLVLRAVSMSEGEITTRRVAWREIELAEPAERQRLEETVLPALLEERLAVAGESSLELASGELPSFWPRLQRWLRGCRRRRMPPQRPWKAAEAWEASGFDPELSWWPQGGALRWVASGRLNRLELAFLATGEGLLLERIARELEAESRAAVAVDWTRSVLLAAALERHARIVVKTVESLLGALETARETAIEPGDGASRAARRQLQETLGSCRWRAEQTLHDVLGATPLSWRAPLPAGAGNQRLRGLSFDAEGRLLALLGEERWSWSPEDLEEPPRREPAASSPGAGEGEVRPKRVLLIGPEEPFPAVPPARPPYPPTIPHARSGHDRAIQFFLPGQLALPPPIRRLPLRLLGHRAVPTFLAFSRRRAAAGKRSEIPRWLVSGAISEDGGAELRLWPIEANGEPRREPRFLRRKVLGDPQRKPSLWPRDSSRGETSSELKVRSRVTRLGRLPVTLEAGGVSWKLVSVENGILTLESSAGAEVRVEIQAEAAGAKGLREVALGPDGRWLTVVTRRGWAGVWSLPDASLGWHLPRGVSTLAWGPLPEAAAAGRQLAVGGLDGTVRLFRDLPRGEPPFPPADARPVELRGGEGLAVRSLAFEGEGRRLWVERQSTLDPLYRRFETHGLDATELARLALSCAGRALEPEELPPGVPPSLVSLLEEARILRSLPIPTFKEKK